MSDDKPCFMNIVARRKLGKDDSWRWLNVQRVGFSNDWIVKGASPIGTLKSGKNKGKPKWPPRAQFDETIVLEQEIKAACDEYEQSTGNCHKCYGKGQEWAGWSHSEGTRYRTCLKCNGTGKSHVSN